MQLEQREDPGGQAGVSKQSRHEEAQRVYGTSPDPYIEHFRSRVLLDALTEATALYWKRRAEALERALPRRGDFHGQATREELWERYNALQAEILACRRHANLLAAGTIAPANAEYDVAAVLREVS
ncbi:hypothetical protein ACFV9C_23310 [Kribbella sp. NPDC059898]|uniref:hypothetical protein n=1 Tax=Kribbella sp. NPDC059898 TaxID=3346995 RepID=UPI00364B90BB